MTLVNTETGEIVGAANYDVHPAATLFPLIEGEAFRSLVEDIRTRGQEVPVVLDRDGRLLDGRNRVRACQAIGVDVKESRYDGDDPYGFVVSHNMHRRHLTESQRAMVAAKLANLRNGEQRRDALSIDRACAPITTRAAAKSLNVGEASAHRARSIRDHGTPDLIHAVEVGEISVNKASEIVAAADKNPIRVAELHADHKAGKAVPKPAKKNQPPAPPKYGGNRKKHLAVIDSIATAASGLAIAADEITSLDQSITDEEAARLAGDLSKSIRSLNRIKALLNNKENTR